MVVLRLTVNQVPCGKQRGFESLTRHQLLAVTIAWYDDPTKVGREDSDLI